MMSADLKPHLPSKSTSHRAGGGCCVLEPLLLPPSEKPVGLCQLLQLPQGPGHPSSSACWHCGHTKDVTLLLAYGAMPIFSPTHHIFATNHNSGYSHLPELDCAKQEEQYRSNRAYCVWGGKIPTQNPNQHFGTVLVEN